LALPTEEQMDFDQLIDNYKKPIYNLIYRLISNADEAADLTQDTFISAFTAAATFRGECAVYTWLCRIAVNKCRNRYRQTSRRRELSSVSLDDANVNVDSVPGMSADSSDSPHESLQRKELMMRIEQAIDELSYDYRIVVVLRDMQGLSYQEVAEAASLSVDVVRTRLARARAALRKKLEPYLRG
jgi:RNA polymerase sigma-70 factor, ECF subfamily